MAEAKIVEFSRIRCKKLVTTIEKHSAIILQAKAIKHEGGKGESYYYLPFNVSFIFSKLCFVFFKYFKCYITKINKNLLFM